MKRTHCIALAALALGVLVPVPYAEAQTKKVTFAVAPLNPPPGTDTTSVRAINNNGQATGSASIGGTSGRACIWEQTAGQWVGWDLGLAAYFSSSSALEINDLSQIVGSGTDFDGFRAAYFYDDVTGTCETLPGPNGMQSNGSAINNLGVICGSSYSGSGSTYVSTATLWERKDGVWAATDLAAPFESLDNRRSYATDVNDANLVIGYSYVYDGAVTDTRAHVWERDTQGVWTLADLPGESPNASETNNVGQILGTHLVNGTSYPCIWNRVGGNWTLTDLSSFVLDLKDFGYSGINDLGHVFTTGHPLDGTGYAVPILIKNGAVFHLNDCRPDSLLPNWYLTHGWQMNNQGQLVGFMEKSGSTDKGHFIWDTQQATYSYTSTGSAVAIKDKSTASKAMTLTDNVTITDLNVKVTLYHTRYADLQFDLVGPDNFTRKLCNAGAVTGSGTKTLVFDDEGAAGTIIPPDKVLHLYDGTSTAGKWTLKITDTVKNYKTGSFTSFTLDVVPL